MAGGYVAVFRDGRRAVVTVGSSSMDVTSLAACLYTLAHTRTLEDGPWRLQTARGLDNVEVRLLAGV
jgi:hypothetical protein